MGTWGTQLFDNDFACDVRDSYIDQLKKGNTNEVATEFLIGLYQCSLNDSNEALVFWCALADTQWNYGRLMPEIKKQALYYLNSHNDERWVDLGQDKLSEWKKHLGDLDNKLNSPQPAKKRISKYKKYICPWKIGDVFAYKLTGQYSKEAGLDGQYIIFRKVDEAKQWPGNVFPIIHFYKWIGSELPTIEDVSQTPFLEMNYSIPQTNLEKLRFIPQFFGCLDTSPIQKNGCNMLEYMGNIPIDGIRLIGKHNNWQNQPLLGWETSKLNNKIETFFIKQYLLWSTNRFSNDSR